MVSEDDRQCPQCGGRLKYHDSIPRIVKSSGGRKRWDQIRRFVCVQCGSVHREIPDYLLPFKHYESEVIHGFISGQISFFDLEYEDYPCENTIRNWLNEYGKLPR